MKNYNNVETKHDDLDRIVDREGNWEVYFHKPTNQYLRGITSILSRAYAKGLRYENWLASVTSEQRENILRTTGDRGDKIHRFIDIMLNATAKTTWDRTIEVFSKNKKTEEQLSNDEWDAVLSFAHFWNIHNPLLLVSEAPMFNLELGYAGTADALFIIQQACGVKACGCANLVGKIGLWDWKTGSGIRASYSAQTAAYANATNIREYLPHGADCVDYIAVLRLGTSHKTTKGYEMAAYMSNNPQDMNSMQRAFARFKSAIEIDNFEYAPFEPKDIVEIPDVVELTVNKFDFEKAKEIKKVVKIKKPRKNAKNNNPSIANL